MYNPTIKIRFISFVKTSTLWPHCICGFCVILRINSCYFPAELYIWDCRCLLWGTSYIYVCCVDGFSASVGRSQEHSKAILCQMLRGTEYESTLKFFYLKAFRCLRPWVAGLFKADRRVQSQASPSWHSGTGTGFLFSLPVLFHQC
jgi:hypothetical protein